MSTNKEKLKKLEGFLPRMKGKEKEPMFLKFMNEYHRVKKLVENEELERQEAETLAAEKEALDAEKALLEKQKDTKPRVAKESMKNPPIEVKCENVEEVKPTHEQTAAMSPEKRLPHDTLNYGEDLLNCKAKIKKIRAAMGKAKANSNDFWKLKRFLDAEQENYFEFRDKWTMEKQEERDKRFDTLQEINLAKMTEMIVTMVEMTGSMNQLGNAIYGLTNAVTESARAEAQQMKTAEEYMQKVSDEIKDHDHEELIFGGEEVTEKKMEEEPYVSKAPVYANERKGDFINYGKKNKKVEQGEISEEIIYDENDYRSLAAVPADNCHHAVRDDEQRIICNVTEKECDYIYKSHDCTMSNLCTFKRDPVSKILESAISEGGKQQCPLCDKWFVSLSSHLHNNVKCKTAMMKAEN